MAKYKEPKNYAKMWLERQPKKKQNSDHPWKGSTHYVPDIQKSIFIP